MKSNSIKTLISGAAPYGLFLIMTAGAPAAHAAVPELISFQGKLSDSAGKAVNSAVPMVFKFYTAASGGLPVWTETQSVTPDNSGIYGVLLGEVTPFNVSFSTAYWLGVAVGTDSEMLPRYRMVSSAYSLYSLNSATAAWAGGADWPTITNRSSVTVQGNTFNGASQLLQLGTDGKLPALDGSNLTGVPTAIANGAITTAKLADSAVTDAKVSLSTAAITSGKFGDARVAISTQAVSGGIYNAAGMLVQLGADGSLPALNGSNLTGLTKAQVGLNNVDNTADAAKAVLSAATVTGAAQTAITSVGTLTGLTVSAPIAGSVTGSAATANIAGGTGGEIPYQSAANTTVLLPAGTAGKVLQSNGAAAPSWVTASAGDAYRASSQTFTGSNIFRLNSFRRQRRHRDPGAQLYAASLGVGRLQRKERFLSRYDFDRRRLDSSGGSQRRGRPCEASQRRRHYRQDVHHQGYGRERERRYSGDYGQPIDRRECDLQFDGAL